MQKLRLKSEQDREIEEMVAQIRMKFDGKLKEAEVEYNLKKNELDLYMNRVFMNKMLAAAFRHKCMDIKSASLQGGQRGIWFSTFRSFVNYYCHAYAGTLIILFLIILLRHYCLANLLFNKNNMGVKREVIASGNYGCFCVGNFNCSSAV